MNFAVVVPTLNAAADWPRFCSALLENVAPQSVLIIDSESTDGTKALAQAAGFRVHGIRREEFNHGGTRQLAVELLPDAEIIVFLTQDAVLVTAHSIGTLVELFKREDIGAAFGRQLPHPRAKPIEAHARLFNYPAQSSIRTLTDKEYLGFKSIFISNSFAAYRRLSLNAVGGFPRNVIFGEDTITAAKLLLAGWKIAYVAEAQVYHSHSYKWRQEFRRYFDIGVLHVRESWLLKEFGDAGGEGARFVKSELRYLWPRYWFLVPSALIRTTLKLAGYRLGKMEEKLGPEWKRRLSMNRQFWS
jgi:rhamnosyltransferase